MGSKVLIGKKAIQKILSESVFNPKDNTPFSVVVNLGDPSYAELRATECISDARFAIKNGNYQMYIDKIGQAISLLAVARALRANNTLVAKVSNTEIQDRGPVQS